MKDKDYCMLDRVEDMKICSKCNSSLSLDKFYVDKSKKDGRHSSCIECNQRDRGIKKPVGKRVYINYELEERMCTNCNKILYFSEFYKVSGKRGYSAMCKDCIHIKGGCKKKNSSPCSVDFENQKKTCATCGELLDFECFHKTDVKYNSSGRYSSCIKCVQKSKGVKNPGPKRCFIDYEKEIRECSKCHRTLSFNDFHKNRNTKSGYCSTCKECIRIEKNPKSRRCYIDYENEIRECSKCHELLTFEEFYKSSKSMSGVTNCCKNCCYKKHRSEEFRKQRRIHAQENKDKIQKNRKNCRHKTRITSREYVKNRKENDVQYKLCIILRGRLYSALKRESKAGSAVKDLGCSIRELKIRLESTFYTRKTGEEMSWSNYGRKGWHIDHRIPLSSFDLTNREDFLKAVHYTNLQPLWAEDNLYKGDRVE